MKAFENKWTHQERQDAYALLEIVDHYMAYHNYKYVLSYGTLLGQIRFNDFLPWDDDLDILLLDYTFSKEDLATLANIPNIQVTVKNTSWVKISLIKNPNIDPHAWSFPCLDIFSAEIIDGKYTFIDHRGIAEFSTYIDDILEIKCISFGQNKIKVNIPQNPKSHCIDIYGKECLVYARPPYWNHKEEKVIQTDYQAVSIIEIADHYDLKLKDL